MSSQPNYGSLMNKNIVICCDGTGNKFGQHNTNIVKISQACLHDDSESAPVKQIVYYDPGVGTLNLPGESWYTKLKSAWCGLGFGYGLNQNIIDAYEYLMENYQPDDKVFLFGFSRGAYTVRALAGMIFRFGLLRKGSTNLIPYVSDMYHQFRQNQKIDYAIAAEFKQSFSQECKPQFIGVFDTVAAMGHLNRSKIFYDASLNPDVKFGYHALSIDEKRAPFSPFLWDESKKTTEQTIEQVWFSGDHGNIGGGHEDASLSDITLQWMLRNALLQGLALKEDWEKKLNPNPTGKLYDLYNFLWGLAGIYHAGYFGRKARKIDNNALIHQSVQQRIELVPGYTPHLPEKYFLVR